MKILFIAPSLPLNHGSGGSMRSFQLYNEFKKMGEVDVVTCSNTDSDLNQLKRFEDGGGIFFGHIVVSYDHNFHFIENKDINDTVDAFLNEKIYDYVFVRYYNTAFYLGLFGLSNLIVDCDDYLPEIIEQSFSRKIKKLQLNTYLQQALQKFKIAKEKRLIDRTISNYKSNLSRCAAVIYSNENTYIEKLQNVSIIPNKVAKPEPYNATPPKPVQARLLFIGVLNYEPNLKGLDRFITDIWPTVIKRRPNVELKIVGRGLPDYIRHKWSRIPGLQICDFVESIHDVYQDVDFSIVPVDEGSGTHIKLIESLMFNKTLIVTRFAHRGYEESLRNGESLLVAHNDIDFIRKVITLIDDEHLRKLLANNGHQRVVDSHVIKDSDCHLRQLVSSIV